MTAEPKPFLTRYNTETETMIVELVPEFKPEDWTIFSSFSRKHIASGVLRWDLNLGKLFFMSSPLLGSVIGLNTFLRTRQGALRLIVKEGSSVANLMHLSKLDQIVETQVVP